MGLQKNPLIGTVVETGDLFPTTGYYSFAGHKDDVGEGCFVPPQVKFGMLFERGGGTGYLTSWHARTWSAGSWTPSIDPHG